MFEKLKQVNCESDDAYVIAEVGNNHQGDLSIALDYIREFSNAGANAIKFQTRNNKELFTEKAFDQKYNSNNAFAETYGQHRELLELSESDVLTLYRECQKMGVDFLSTPFDSSSLKYLFTIGLRFFKIASFDIGNIPFISEVGERAECVILSTGGGDVEDIDASVEVLSKLNCQVVLLHCVSLYPCPVDRLALGKIKTLKQRYPNVIIGLSDHFNGVLSGPLAYTLGARVFEKHVTLDRSWKGTDHAFSLEKDGFRKFCRDIRRTPVMLRDQDLVGDEIVFQKLGKSVFLKQNVNKGDIFDYSHVTGKIDVSPGYDTRKVWKLKGKTYNRTLKAGSKLSSSDFQ